MIKRFLIVYYSPCRRCYKLAQFLHGEIGGDIEGMRDLRPAKNRLNHRFKNLLLSVKGRETPIMTPSFNPSDYGDIIIITPVYMGRLNCVARTYISLYRSALSKVVTTIVGISSSKRPKKLSTDFLSRKYGISIRGIVPIGTVEIRKDRYTSKLDTLVRAL